MNKSEEGKLPTQPLPNPRGMHNVQENNQNGLPNEQVKAITTLRSGRKVDNKVEQKEAEGEKEEPTKIEVPEKEAEEESEIMEQKEEKVKEEEPTKVKMPEKEEVVKERVYQPKAPFPHRLKGDTSTDRKSVV